MTNNVIDLVPEMVTIKDAAARTGLSYYWLRNLCLQQKIVCIRAGSKYLINFGKLCEYLNKGDQEESQGDADGK